MSTLKERIEMAAGRIPKFRKAHLAKACNISAASVSDWFNGETKSLKISTARLAARYLRCNPYWLAEGHGSAEWIDERPDEAVTAEPGAAVYLPWASERRLAVSPPWPLSDVTPHIWQQLTAAERRQINGACSMVLGQIEAARAAQNLPALSLVEAEQSPAAA